MATHFDENEQEQVAGGEIQQEMIKRQKINQNETGSENIRTDQIKATGAGEIQPGQEDASQKQLIFGDVSME